MSETALVTIAIPTCNGARWLAGAISSAIAQTYRRTEILIIDDASDDDSVGIITEFEDSRLRLLRNEERLGLGGNWNRCIAEAHGEFITFRPG